MKVYSREAAWIEANKIFPTDYMKNEKYSENAGYPIYWSTLENCNAWISDLNTSLEVNLENGKSIRIWIDENPVLTALEKDGYKKNAQGVWVAA